MANVKGSVKSANTRMSCAVCARAAETFRETGFRERHLEQHWLEGREPHASGDVAVWVLQHPTGRSSIIP